MITENTTLGEVLKYKGAEKIMNKFKVPCLHCPMAKYEIEKLKLKQITQAYGIDLKNLLKELNNNLFNKKQKND